MEELGEVGVDRADRYKEQGGAVSTEASTLFEMLGKPNGKTETSSAAARQMALGFDSADIDFPQL